VAVAQPPEAVPIRAEVLQHALWEVFDLLLEFAALSPAAQLNLERTESNRDITGVSTSAKSIRTDAEALLRLLVQQASAKELYIAIVEKLQVWCFEKVASSSKIVRSVLEADAAQDWPLASDQPTQLCILLTCLAEGTRSNASAGLPQQSHF
jgi:hypothetical protein